MKKIYTLLALMLFGTATFAQKNESSLTDAYILKGTHMLGGSLSTSFKGFSSDQGSQKNIDKGTVFRINLDGRYGYFVMEDFVVGVKANLRHFNYNTEGPGQGEEETVLLLGPLLRKYFHTGIFTELGVGFGLDNITNGRQSDLFQADLGLGYTYFLNNMIAIEPMVLLQYSKQKFGGSTENIDRSEYGPEFRLGIQAFLFRRKLGTPEMRK
jgi:hypothetical protein